MGGFQTPVTIAEALESIKVARYVLPAIQREFVWSDKKIEALFDSLMRGYPIGGFLFWKVQPKTVADHRFYGVLENFDVRGDGKFCPPLANLSPSDDRYAILDGQQRLTSLNIGLRGSHTVKLPNKWWDNPDAFVKRDLYLDLRGSPSQDDTSSEDETGDSEEYVFRFRTPEQVDAENAAGRLWMRVKDVMKFRDVSDGYTYPAERGFGNEREAARRFARLMQVVHQDAIISYYLENEQSIDRVMNIFIRVNSQGEPLSFADLLLSQATAAWSHGSDDETLDARAEIRSFVEELNGPDRKFDFKRDQIMKAALVLTDATSVRFRIENYDAQRMNAIRTAWPRIKHDLLVASRILETFGLTAVNLNARSVIHPIAYYVKTRELDTSYLEAKAYAEDRAQLRRWVVRSLLRQGIWGSGLDTLLTRLRDAIQKHGKDSFPVEEIEAAMASIGKSLAFNEADVDALLSLKYGDRNAFALLTIAYPTGEVVKRHHVDHVYPRARFTKGEMARAGLPPEGIGALRALADSIPNLQLLTGSENESKSDAWPADWLARQFSDGVARDAMVALHHLTAVSDDLSGFQPFFERRRASLAERLRAQLGVPQRL